jgi:hypothetical protein
MMSHQRRVDSPEERNVPPRFRSLPERVDPEQMVTSQESESPGDPEAGHDPDRDFMLGYSG